MMKVVRILCWVTLVVMISWSIVAIGNGKVGDFFGTEVFIASGTDMKVTLFAQMTAAFALAILGITSWLGRERRV